MVDNHQEPEPLELRIDLDGERPTGLLVSGEPRLEVDEGDLGHDVLCCSTVVAP
ncbi:MAG: hypothetical protein AAGF02_18445 [Actinomycetota bacterium]